MKSLLLAFLFLALKTCGYSQNKIEGLLFFKIGDSLEKFSALISCGEHDSLYGRYYSNSKCRGYHYLPAQKDSISLGMVKFKTVFLHPDSSGIIKSVSFNKYFYSKDSNEVQKKAATEYELLIALFDSMYSKGISKNDYPLNKYYTSEGIRWYSGVKSIVVERHTFVRRKIKGQIEYTNALHVYCE